MVRLGGGVGRLIRLADQRPALRPAGPLEPNRLAVRPAEVPGVGSAGRLGWPNRRAVPTHPWAFPTHTKGGLWPPQESYYLRGHRQGGAHRRRYTHKAVQTKGGLWPPHESCYLRGHRQGGTHRMQCLHKTVHTKGGLWPPQESCYLRGHRQGGTHRARCLHIAVHTKGGLWPPQESCSLEGLRKGLCFLKRHIGWGGHG